MNKSLWNWEAGLAPPPSPEVEAPAPAARPIARLGARKPSGNPSAVAAAPSRGASSDQQAQMRPGAFDVAASYAACS